MRKILHFGGALVAIILVSGCVAPENSASVSARDVFKTALTAPEIGRVFDAATRDLENGDFENLAKNGARLRQLGAMREAQMLAESVISQAAQQDSAAVLLPSDQKRALQAQTSQKYRLALKLSPDFPSQNWQALNALGYFLADLGTTPQDFQQSEVFTRRALKFLNESMSPTPSPIERFNRAITRDSLAWALFRQKKFEAAWREQTNAVAEAQSVLASRGIPESDASMTELKTHLQQIEKALGRETPTSTPPIVPTPTPTPQTRNEILA